MNLFNKSTQITSFYLVLIQLHFFLFFLISITQLPLTSHGCHEHERRELLEFKSSLSSDPADRLFSWQEGVQHQNCCNWIGIECSYDSLHIEFIDLRNTDYENFIKSDGDYSDSALTGELSPSLTNITHLRYLDLAFNNFQESHISFQLSTLTKLTHLDLSNSHFSSSISSQFTNLTSLEYLDLSCVGDLSYDSKSCLKSSSIKWVRGLGNLKVINLSGIDLSKATSSQEDFAEHITNLSNLEYLDISECSISTTTFPIHDFHNLSRLSTLKMNSNGNLSSEIPIEIVNLTSLSILKLSECGLHGTVPYLPQLVQLDVSNNLDLHPDLTRMFQHRWPKLETLSLSNTNVSGSIPVSISNAPLLVSFSASSSSIEGSLPSSINILSGLQFLDLSDNKIIGYIPISFCKLSSLRRLDISNNNITGTVPSCFTNLKNLAEFIVSNNSIGGNVSFIDFINELDLTDLDLSSNRLTVDVDQRFHLYSKFKLQYLSLPSCNLKGLFPTFICKLSNLNSLDLSQNHLAGFIPTYCFSELQFSDSFNLSHNKLHGPLPLLPQCLYAPIDVSNNNLSGEISIENGKRLSSYNSINLAGNELSGSIPFSIFSTDLGVDSINLSNNRFSGSIPFNSICSNDPSVSTPFLINLSNNSFSGIIPSSIGYCTNLFSLNLGINNLSGNVPNELEHASQLRYLQLNNNHLAGTPLNCISKLQSLQVLDLGNNHFGGSIPSLFGSLQDLQILSLRRNKFNRSIPEEIVQLKKLQILDLSENNLTGFVPRKLANLTVLRSRPNDSYSIGEWNFGILVVGVELQRVIKGIMIQFEKLYNYHSGIDLSCNNLEGSIPYEIGLLQGLSTLNLSHNHISGVIPKSVGNMSGLESLDLSFNNLSGQIPQSLTSIGYLGYLNLSHNNLSGRIPREDHFDTLSGDGSAYANNSLLCGLYTNNICEGDQRSNATDANSPSEGYKDDQEDVKDKLLLYAIVALGFVVGFWGLFFVLLLKKEKCWFGYWRFVDLIAARVVNCLS